MTSFLRILGIGGLAALTMVCVGIPRVQAVSERFYWDDTLVEEGGVYDFPLNEVREIETDWDGSYFNVRAEVFYVPDPNGAREFVAAVGGAGEPHGLAWSKEGVYEIDFYKESIFLNDSTEPSFSKKLSRALGDLLPKPAHAEVSDPDYLSTVRFSVGTDVPEPAGEPGQFKMLGVEPIDEGELFVGNSVVLKGYLSDPSGVAMRLEVEVKAFEEEFDGEGTLLSDLVPNNTVAEVEVSELIPKDEQYVSGGNEQAFKWRARTMDEEGRTSEWVSFGEEDDIDFVARTVPLFTQTISDFPSVVETEDWFDEDFANGVADRPGDCGRSIGQCGCAITSTVMIAHYYDVRVGADGEEVQPLNVDAWLLENNGYGWPGNLDWTALEEYTSNELAYVARDDTPDHFNALDEFVDRSDPEPAPLIAKALAGRGGVNRTHFFVIDSKLAEGEYSVRDPYWYNTKTLEETTDHENFVVNYAGGFDGLRMYERGSGNTAYDPYMRFTLASPAELLFTDSLGRHLGKDPHTGEVFNEVPGGQYYEEESIDDPDPNAPDPLFDHYIKILEVPNPSEGSYILEVIGVGSGEYTLSSIFRDVDGGRNGGELREVINSDEVHEYLGVFDEENSDNSYTKPASLSLDELLVLLQGKVEEITHPGIRQATLSHISNVEREIERGKNKKAKKKLNQLESFVKKHKGKHIEEELVEELLAIIEDIRERLSL